MGPLYYWLTETGRRKFWEPKLWGSLGKPKHWKKISNFFFSINFTQIFRICPKMFQFLKYLLHKQIIEMCHSQKLRRPLSVPCPTQWVRGNWCKVFYWCMLQIIWSSFPNMLVIFLLFNRFGVCCLFIVSSASSSISENCTYIQNPRWEISGFCFLSFCQNERLLSFLSLYIFE